MSLVISHLSVVIPSIYALLRFKCLKLKVKNINGLRDWGI